KNCLVLLRVLLRVLLLLALNMSVALAAPADDVRAAGQLWIAGIAKGDPDYMVSLYADDAILHGTTSPVLREGHALIREYFAGLKGKVEMHFVEPQHIRVYGDTAINTGNYETKIGDNAPVKLRYSFVYRKVGSKWLIVDHHSSRLPE
ncbi:MAG TPA: SgcJ/EcaC family oxidoreductase, partial [Candidatus Acidoferrum sp.]|nr:SgcJ/EcaC family oxidoreductase [Candidatus Acidoferrum sp.]